MKDKKRGQEDRKPKRSDAPDLVSLFFGALLRTGTFIRRRLVLAKGILGSGRVCCGACVGAMLFLNHGQE